jgi:hypothetical protein
MTSVVCFGGKNFRFKRMTNRKGFLSRATELDMVQAFCVFPFIFLCHSHFTVELFNARLIFLFRCGDGHSRPPPVSNCPSQAGSLQVGFYHMNGWLAVSAFGRQATKIP